MKRQIIFRGKSVNTDKWLYGCLLKNEEGKFAVVKPFKVNMDNECSYYEVDEDTIGQFTGLHDKNGKEIYEGDIVKRKYVDEVHDYICIWVEEYACFAFKENKEYGEYNYFQKCDECKLRVIGNIYDNPELLNI